MKATVQVLNRESDVSIAIDIYPRPMASPIATTLNFKR